MTRMKLSAIHVLVCGIASCLTPSFWAASLAESNLSIDYFCPNYEGTLEFEKNRVFKRFGVQYPTNERPPDTLVANSLNRLIDCATFEEMLCLQDRPQNSNAGVQTFVYAVPKIVTGNIKYSAAGWEFSTFYEKHTNSTRPSIIVVAMPTDKSSGNSGYKMYIEDGLGIRYLYFEKLMGNLYASVTDYLEYPDITCILQSENGLFSSVRVK